MILPGGPVAVSPSVVAVDPSGETNRLGLETHGLPAIWYLRCGGTLNLCDLNRLDPSTNQTAHWILGKDLLSGIEAPPGTKPSGIVINNSTGDIFWTMNRTDGEQIWRKSPSPGSGFMLTFDTFTYWNTSLASGAWGLTLDSQGNPVFAEANTNSISQLVLESNLIRRFNVGTAVKHLVGDPSNPNEVWFTEENANKIGRLDISTCDVPTCGLLYEWSIPTAVSQPSGITIDSNGNVWFAETAANQIARLDTATNNIFEYPTGTVKSPRQIALSGPDQLFVTEASGAVDVVSTGSSSAYVNGGTSTHVDPASRQLDFQSALASYATPALQYFVYPTVPTKATLYGSDLGGVERFPLQSASNPQGISEGVGVSNMFYADFGLSSITRFDGPVASISPVNSPPVAAADFDRIVEGNTKGGAIVTLDGSKSSDSDSDPLTFRWTGDFGTATGVSPSVFLSLGTHKVELIVNDGHVDSDPAFVQITVVDSTPPIIAAQRSPFPNLFDWTNQTVKVSFSCSDVVWDVPAPNRVYFGSEGRNQTATRTCTDGSGNSASTTLTDINIDKTPPFPDPLAPCRTVPPANQNGWYNTSVTVECHFVDSLSGIPDDIVCIQVIGIDCPGPFVRIVIETEVRNQTTTLCTVDRAGNRGCTAFGHINIDKTPPVITSPQDEQAFILHQKVPANFQCSDVLSGVDTCTASTAFIDTSTVGRHYYYVTSTDKAGNTAAFTAHYDVHYVFVPISLKPSNHMGSTIPVRFQLRDALGNFVSTATARIWIDSLTNPGKGSGSSDTSNYFRYDSTDNQHLFNLSTTGMTTGSHAVYITLDDGTVHTMAIILTS